MAIARRETPVVSTLWSSIAALASINCDCTRSLLLHDVILGKSVITSQGGNFHLKVGGGAQSSGNAGDPMLGVAVITKNKKQGHNSADFLTEKEQFYRT